MRITETMSQWLVCYFVSMVLWDHKVVLYFWESLPAAFIFFLFSLQRTPHSMLFYCYFLSCLPQKTNTLQDLFVMFRESRSTSEFSLVYCPLGNWFCVIVRQRQTYHHKEIWKLRSGLLKSKIFQQLHLFFLQISLQSFTPWRCSEPCKFL